MSPEPNWSFPALTYSELANNSTFSLSLLEKDRCLYSSIVEGGTRKLEPLVTRGDFFRKSVESKQPPHQKSGARDEMIFVDDEKGKIAKREEDGLREKGCYVVMWLGCWLAERVDGLIGYDSYEGRKAA